MGTNIMSVFSELFDTSCWVTLKNMKSSKKCNSSIKVPIDPKNGDKASITYPGSWGTYEEANKMSKEGDTNGIGFVFSNNDPYAVITILNSRNDQTGKINAKARSYINKFKSYAEISSSGTDIHIFVKGKLPGPEKKTNYCEVFDNGRFIEITGNRVDNAPTKIAKKPNTLLNLYNDISNVVENNPVTLKENATDYDIAQEVIKQIGRKNIFSLAKEICLWNQEAGFWRIVGGDDIKNRIIATMGGNKINITQVNKILELITTLIYSPDSRLSTCDKHAINCKNGELYLIENEWVLKPHKRDSNFGHQIPVIYDESATCELFDKFLQEIFDKDEDKSKKIRLLQELFGYTLITSCEFERFFLLVGNGSNGKSVIISVLKALVGLINISCILPNQFDKLPKVAHLHGKLANIATEIPNGVVFDDAILKSICSGETITVEHRKGNPFEFQPYATQIFSANQLPHTKDCTLSFFRRAEIITFNATFTGSECDTTLKDKLPKELSGILNFALKGLKRLFTKGNFTEVPSGTSTKQDWHYDEDHLSSFINDCCEFNPTEEISISYLYDFYKTWVKEYGIKSAVSKVTLTARLKRMGCKEYRTKHARMLKGVKVDFITN